jgi:hypothetical protein
MSATIALSVFVPVFLAAPGEAQVPSPWTYADVGNVGTHGSATLTDNNLTIKAAGADIWGSADSFGYLYQPFAGDGYATVGVDSLQNTNTFAQAGVMLRQSLDPGSPEVFIDMRPSGDVEFKTRSSAGAATTYVAGAWKGFPAWIELFRNGSTVTAYASSPNGRTTIGSTTIAMGQNLLIGVAVTSHNTSTLTTATFGPPFAHTYSFQSFPVRSMMDADIGAVGRPGAAVYDNGRFTVRGAGADIWGTADAFHMLGLTVARPSGQIITRVTSMGNTDTFAKAGIDIRLGRGPSFADSHVMLDARPTGDIEFEMRPTAGAQTMYLGGAVHQLPVWLKLAVSQPTISGYVSSDGLQWTLIGTAQPDFAGMDAADGWITGGLVVTSHNTSLLNTSTFDNVAFLPGPDALPQPWANGDVGDTGAAGSASWAGGRYTLKGSGADIWGTTDAFQFMYQRFNGCCGPENAYSLGHVEMSARVTTLQNTDRFAKAGVMLRSSNPTSFTAPFDPSGADVMLDVNPTGNVEFAARPAKGAGTTYVSGTTVTGPVWLKLARVNDVVSGYVSVDGTNWTKVGSVTTGVSVDDAEFGIAVSSHVRGTLNTATFDHVELRIPQ